MLELLGWLIIGWCFVLGIVFHVEACRSVLQGNEKGVASGLYWGAFWLTGGVLGVLRATGHGFSLWLFLAVVIGVGVANVLYFIPTIVATAKIHPNAVAILALNFFLGWSFLGWVVALVWALVNTNVNASRFQQANIPLDDGKEACRKCGRRMSRGLLCTDGSCQQCYKPSWSA